MVFDDAVCSLIRLRREPCLLVLEILFSHLSERLFTWRSRPKHLRLLDAQQLGGENLFRLRDVGRLSLAPAPSASRVNPRNPESLAVFALVYAISLLR